MKILRLRLENLNSLVGKWLIDFEHPDYVQNGLFAITGPTGAGKSTILDAICLGLFGQTPRLSSIGKQENEIMSRHCAHCMAEVTFAVGNRVYRSTWSQSRARKQVKDALQESKHELVDALSDNIIEEKKSRTIAAIENITHLNFKRFTRSVLLAQGSFAAFLQASVSERSDMLQQITGTEIYETISKQVHVNKREAEQQLQYLKAAAEGISLMSDEQLQQLQTQFDQATQEHVALETQLNQAQAVLQQWHTYQTLEQTQAQLAQQWQAVLDNEDTYQQQQRQLTQAENANQLQAPFATLLPLRQMELALSSKIQSLQDALIPLAQQQQEAHTRYLLAQQAHQQWQTQEAQQQLLWQEAHLLEARMASESDKQAQWAQQQREQQAQQAKLLAQCQEIETKQATWAQQQQTLQTQLDAHAHLQSVVTELPLWQQQWQTWQGLQHTHTLLQQNQNDWAENLTKAQTTASDIERFLQQNQDTQQALLSQLAQDKTVAEQWLQGKHISEYETEQQLLQQQKWLLAKIESLESERAHLQSGEACPLCGATEHPFVDQHQALPNSNATTMRLNELQTLISNWHAQQKHMQTTEQQLRQLQEQAQFRQNDWQAAQADIGKWQQKHQQAVSETQALEANMQQLLQDLKDNWRATQLPEPATAHDWPEAFTQLQQMLTNQQQQLTELKECALQSQALDKDFEHLQSTLAQLTAQLQETQTQYAHSQQTLQTLQQQHHDLLGGDTLQNARSLWQQQWQQVQAAQEQAHGQWQQVLQQHQLTTERLQDAQTDWHHNHQALTQQESQFAQLIEQHGFVDEDAWQTQCLDLTHMQQLRQAVQEHEHRLRQTQKDIESNQQALQNCRQNLPSEQNATEAAHLYEQLKRQQLQHNQLIGSLQQQLQQQQQAQEQYAKQHQLILLQQQQYQRWLKLHDLIGSSDGAKYRLFAQSLTFNHLVQQANVQLQRMNERYLLQQSSEHLLQLNVIDLFQGNEVRSAKNLSGGESFIVSLALALGLSQLSGQHSHIQSLFLDEGFGTLDEEALEMALNALASLQQEGKMIGVISHVSALKERISTQIQVVPTQNGTSRLKGSGIHLTH